jgi:hypothetical protein
MSPPSFLPGKIMAIEGSCARAAFCRVRLVASGVLEVAAFALAMYAVALARRVGRA